MSKDLRKALDDIVVICNQSRTYTRRIQLIHEIAMRALGMTAGQREQRHIAVFDRLGDAPAKSAFEQREDKRRARAASADLVV